MNKRFNRTGALLIGVGVLFIFLWLWGELYFTHDSLQASQRQVQHLTAQLDEAHFTSSHFELRQREIEKRIREARRLAQQKAYLKLSDFFTALQKETELQKSNDLYLVVSLSEGRLYVKRGVQTLREHVISFGSGGTLKKEGKKWIFDTPRGVFPVLDKKENPVWVKPDWAFVEKGEPIPPLDSALRRVKGDLGKYGIYLGNGYLIHGTPPEKEPLIGLNLSHGCIRMIEQDLKEVYDTVKIHTPVIIR